MSAINEMLVKGIAPPTFEEITGAAVVTFRGNVLGPRRETAQAAGRPESRPESLDRRVPALLQPQDLGKAEISVSACSFAELQAAAGMKARIYLLKIHLESLLLAGWIERTIPDKQRSSKQKYRLKEKGIRRFQ